MAHESDEILRRYIEKIVRLQRERQQEELSENDLRQIAVEAGMSDADLAYAEKRMQEYLDRGKGFIRYRNWDRAITELDQAMALAPANTTILNALASAHWNRFLLRGTDEDRDMAARYAERTLRIDPRNDPALQLLSTIHRGEEEQTDPGPGASRKRPGRAPSPRHVILAIVAGLLILIGLIVLIPSSDSDGPGPPPAIEQPGPPQAAPPLPPPAAEIPADTGFASLVASFGDEGMGPGLFSDGRSIASDGAGNIYVAEYSNGRVQMFDSAGTFLTQWNIGTKKLIRAMTADGAGNIYIAHSGGLYRYEGSSGTELGRLVYGKRGSCTDVAATPDGGLISSWDGNARSGIMIDPQGKDDIVRFNRNGKVVKSIPNAISAAADEFDFNARVAEDGLGNIYAIGSIHKAVFKFSPEGKFITRFGEGESGKLSSPDAITTDGQGRVYVADFGGVQVFDPQGGYLGNIDVRGAASGMVFNRRGELLVVARTKVYRYAIRK